MLGRRALLPLVGLLFGRSASAQTNVSISLSLTEQLDTFQSAAQAYTLSRTPAAGTNPKVFVNGLLMSVAAGDYTIAGQTLTFTGQQTAAMDSPVIQKNGSLGCARGSGRRLSASARDGASRKHGDFTSACDGILSSGKTARVVQSRHETPPIELAHRCLAQTQSPRSTAGPARR